MTALGSNGTLGISEAAAIKKAYAAPASCP